jgi:hypothetical protein
MNHVWPVYQLALSKSFIRIATHRAGDEVPRESFGNAQQHGLCHIYTRKTIYISMNAHRNCQYE